MAQIDDDLPLNQLADIINEGYNLFQKSKHDDLSDQKGTVLHKIASKAHAAVIRLSGPASTYAKDVETILGTKDHQGRRVVKLIGVLESLHYDIKLGYLKSFTELIHGEVFGDFMDMAYHLSEEGYKDPAAVVAGAALESHLKLLCSKHGIQKEFSTNSGFRPKKADQINADLAKADVISKLDQKNVTAWLGLRNKAAHGEFTEYTKDQVKLMIDSIRDFITRNPA